MALDASHSWTHHVAREGYVMIDQDKEAVLRMRVTAQFKKRVETAAAVSGMGVSEWMRAVLARAVTEGAYAPRPTRKGRKED
jgi:hypothetical protein